MGTITERPTKATQTRIDRSKRWRLVKPHRAILVSDATATFDRVGWNGADYFAEDIHNIHLASLNGEFCAVRSTETVLSEVV